MRRVGAFLFLVYNRKNISNKKRRKYVNRAVFR